MMRALLFLLASLGLVQNQPASISDGKRVFDQACQSCHGPAGQGDRGPALNRGTFTHGNEDGDLARVIRVGVPGTEMPPFPRLTDEQTRQLVAYIRSLSGSDAAPTTAINTATAAAGEALFFGKAQCSACHEVNGRGAMVGPDLSTAGRFAAPLLRQKILRPSEPIATGRSAGPAPQVLVAPTSDGREIRGVRRNEDTFSAQIVDASGTLHLVDKTPASAFRIEKTSLMPGDYGTRLTAAEIDQLTAYLGTRRERAAVTAAAMPSGGVTADRLANADSEPHNWLMYWGNYQATHYSALDQIASSNVNRLTNAWTFQMPNGSVLEATPIVADGLMYVTEPGVVVALDARTGRQTWRFTRPQKVKSPYEINPFNRGVAVLGHRLFVGTLDAALLALDARTGRLLWEVQIADSMLGHSLTSAPLIVKDKVLVGITGGEFGARGFLDAYDAATGKRLWRWF